MRARDIGRMVNNLRLAPFIAHRVAAGLYPRRRLYITHAPGEQRHYLRVERVYPRAHLCHRRAVLRCHQRIILHGPPITKGARLGHNA